MNANGTEGESISGVYMTGGVHLSQLLLMMVFKM